MSERFILVGFLLFVVVILPILLVRDYRQRKKVRKIIQSYRDAKEKNSSDEENIREDSPSGAEGWGMNNSPFSERKSGLTWGGGNIKAAEAKRGTKRIFMGK